MTSPARRARLVLAAVLVGATMAVAGPGTESVRAYPGSAVRVTGHGWGHGRGMGQFGAQGYATMHGWEWTRILDHYYGNTYLGDLPGNPEITVHITRKDGAGVIATNAAEAGAKNAVYIERIGANQFRRHVGDGCGGPWSGATVINATAVDITPKGGQPLGLCDADGTKLYRGFFRANDIGGMLRLVNHVDTESYVKGVVTKEVGGSFDADAIMAQAVAVRSYAWASPRPGNRVTYAQQCDSTQCQVYQGIAGEPGTVVAAVGATATKVRRFHGSNAIASTEYSSSTGGHTAGGTFPAVPDAGDSVSSNPNHTWRTDIAVSAIQAAYPEIGTLMAVDITGRNGHGEWGGRVTQLVLRGSNGNRTLSGNDFRSRFGLKSDWFTVTSNASGGIDGYWVAAPDGGVFAFGNAQFHGSMGGKPLNRPVLGMAASASGNGYWLVASDGGIFSFGDAAFRGSTGGMRLNQPVVGMEPRPDGSGYWLVASDGGIFSFGVPFYGSMGGKRLNKPVVGMAATPSGNGYWLVASDGGIFTFGDAQFHGSTGSLRLNAPIVGMAPTPNGGGYWLVASDGGIFSFGNAGFHGSLGGTSTAGAIAGMQATKTGGGYNLVSAAGRVYAFGDAPYLGDVATVVPGYRGGVRGIDVHRMP